MFPCSIVILLACHSYITHTGTLRGKKKKKDQNTLTTVRGVLLLTKTIALLQMWSKKTHPMENFAQSTQTQRF